MTDAIVAHLKTFKDFPPAQKGVSLSFDQLKEQITKSAEK